MKTLKFTTTLPRCLIFLVGPGAAPMTSTADKAHLTGKNRDGSGPGQKSATPAATRKRHSAKGLVWLRGFLLLSGVIGSASALGLTVTTPQEAKLVDKGARVFNQETFKGNGRTCSTCHIDKNHYNISPADIREIRDPRQRELIFLTHTVPGFENEKLVRERALFNIGPDIGAGKHPHGPFRTTMTVGGIELTDTDSRPTPDRRAITLGWAADGSPDFLDLPFVLNPFNEAKFNGTDCQAFADGSIEAFAIGAVVQHATKTLKRRPGKDFRCPTQAELVAMGAFQRWLGRQAIDPTSVPPKFDLDITKITFTDPRANTGRDHFLDGKFGCDACHDNAGANANFSVGNNANFQTNVDFFGKNPVLGVKIPADEGDLIEEEVPKDSICHFTTPDSCRDGVGFNSQSLVEAVFKNQFNHNGSVIGSIEDAAKFYFTDTFNNSPAGHGRACALAGDRNGFATAPIGTGIPPGPNADRTTCVRPGPVGTTGRTPVPLIAADFITLANIQIEFGSDAFNKLGFFLRSLGAVYKARDCERLVEETILRIQNHLSTDLPVKHCQFNLDDIASGLKNARVGSLSPAYIQVVSATRGLKVQLASAARRRDTGSLQAMQDTLKDLREKIATTTELP